MRVFLLSCAVTALCAANLSAQSISDVIAPENRHFDFGAVPKASKVEHRFALRNPFKTDLHIQSVRTSCGCTTPSLENQVIKPGETGFVMAKFNTDRFSGEKKATLTLSIAKPYFTELQLNVKGYIRTDIVLNPGEAAFGSVPEGTAKQLTLDLNYAGRSDWQIKDIICPYSFVKANFQEISRNNGRVQYAIQVNLDGAAPEGYLSSQIVIHTNDHRLKTFPLRFTATVEKPMQIAPPKVALGKVKPNEPISQRLTISGKSDFQVIGLTSDIAEIRFEPNAKSSRVHMLQVIISPKLPQQFSDGEVNGVIEIQTDAGDAPLKIPLSFVFETDKLADVE